MTQQQQLQQEQKQKQEQERKKKEEEERKKKEEEEQKKKEEEERKKKEEEEQKKKEEEERKKKEEEEQEKKEGKEKKPEQQQQQEQERQLQEKKKQIAAHRFSKDPGTNAMMESVQDWVDLITEKNDKLYLKIFGVTQADMRAHPIASAVTIGKKWWQNSGGAIINKLEEKYGKAEAQVKYEQGKAELARLSQELQKKGEMQNNNNVQNMSQLADTPIVDEMDVVNVNAGLGPFVKPSAPPTLLDNEEDEDDEKKKEGPKIKL